MTLIRFKPITHYLLEVQKRKEAKMKTKIEDLTPEQISRLLVIAQDTLSLNHKVTIDSEEELVDFVEDTVPGS